MAANNELWTGIVCCVVATVTLLYFGSKKWHAKKEQDRVAAEEAKKQRIASFEVMKGDEAKLEAFELSVQTGEKDVADMVDLVEVKKDGSVTEKAAQALCNKLAGLERDMEKVVQHLDKVRGDETVKVERKRLVKLSSVKLNRVDVARSRALELRAALKQKSKQ